MDKSLKVIGSLDLFSSTAIEDNDIAWIICDLNAKQKPINGSTESTFQFSLDTKSFILVFGQMTPIVIRIA